MRPNPFEVPMARRLVSLVLLPCLLLTQSAVRGHAHDCGHDTRPHFHTTPRQHDDCGHGHETPAGEHDHDAVYLSAEDVAGVERFALPDDVPASGWLCPHSVVNVPHGPPPNYLVPYGHSPPAAPLYVVHRALLI